MSDLSRTEQGLCPPLELPSVASLQVVPPVKKRLHKLGRYPRQPASPLSNLLAPRNNKINSTRRRILKSLILGVSEFVTLYTLLSTPFYPPKLRVMDWKSIVLQYQPPSTAGPASAPSSSSANHSTGSLAVATLVDGTSKSPRGVDDALPRAQTLLDQKAPDQKPLSLSHQTPPDRKLLSDQNPRRRKRRRLGDQKALAQKPLSDQTPPDRKPLPGRQPFPGQYPRRKMRRMQDDQELIEYTKTRNLRSCVACRSQKIKVRSLLNTSCRSSDR